MSVWDNYTHERPNLDADIACDSYHKMDEDIAAIKAMHLTHYRFSLSWTRFFPDGKNANKDPNAIKYYDDFIDKLLENNIIPMITLFHWDTPQALQDEFKGFSSDKIVEYFKNFADFAFNRYGEKVKFWFTFNEPWSYCVSGNDIGVFAPGVRFEGYQCGHNQLLSHAEVYHLYDEQYRSKSPNGEGQIGWTCISEYAEPQDRDNPEHLDAADRFMQFWIGWFWHPIFSEEGDYPPTMREYRPGMFEPEKIF